MYSHPDLHTQEKKTLPKKNALFKCMMKCICLQNTQPLSFFLTPSLGKGGVGVDGFDERLRDCVCVRVFARKIG